MATPGMVMANAIKALACGGQCYVLFDSGLQPSGVREAAAADRRLPNAG
jgi:hypothetical protein